MINRITWQRSEFATLKTQMEELFDSFFGGLTSRYFVPSMDSFVDSRLIENEQEFVMMIELPALDIADIDLSVTGNSLTIKIEQAEERFTNSKGTPGRETLTRSSIRNFRLPNNVQTDRIEASYADGLLKIKLPKREKTLQRIQIKT
jgi:HSP20 family protein